MIPVSPQQRIENASQTVGERLDYMLENGDLDESQKAAIMEAKEEFQGYMSRLGNALEGGDFAIEDKGAKNFARFMGHLKDEVHSALNDTPVLPPSGEGEDKGPPRVQPTGMVRVGGGPSPEEDLDGVSPEALSERLEGAQSSIEDRLSNLRSQGMDAESAARLADAYDQFTATVDRMQYGIENGTVNESQLAKGFQFALDSLREGLRPVPPGETDGSENTRAAGVDEGQPVGASPVERLESVAGSIGSRLEGLLAGADPEAARALTEASETFGSLVDRLGNALQNGFDADNAGSAFARMLEQLKGDVHGALGQNGSPKLYDSSMAMASLYELGSTGVDTEA